MFQKLYKHLEEINTNTREQIAAARDASVTTGRLSEQLASVNQSILLQTKAGRPSSLPIVNLVIICLGIVVVGIFAYNTFQLSRSSRNATENAAGLSRALKSSYIRYNGVAGRQVSAEAEISRLDSLVRQQAQSILELKKLNEMAVRTFIRIRRDLDRKEDVKPSMPEASATH